MLEAFIQDLKSTWDAFRFVGMYPEVVLFSLGILYYVKWYKKWDSRKASPIAFVSSVIGNVIYARYQGNLISISWTIFMGVNIGLVTLGIHYIVKRYKILDRYFGNDKKDA
jgi:hypothetical protein